MISMIREAIQNLDTEFIAKAADCSSFNIPAKYFESKEKKLEIRHLFQVNWFNGSDITFYEKFSPKSYQSGVEQLRGINSKNFKKLFLYKPNGIGPGEIIAYFLFDDVSLGGGGSGGVDLYTSGKEYEMKATRFSTDIGPYGKGKYIWNFKLGGTVGVDKLVTKLKDMKKEAAKTDPSLGKSKEVGYKHYQFFIEYLPEQWKEVLEEYQTKAHTYFGNTPLIAVSAESKGGYEMGDVIFAGSPKKENILIGSQTSGGIKPIIKIK